MDFFGSDHRVLQLKVKKSSAGDLKRYKRRFTFEHKWLIDEEFMEFFKQNWADVQRNQSLQTTLSQCNINLSKWAGNRFDNLGKKIKDLRHELSIIMRSHVIKKNLPRIRLLEREIEKLSEQEEVHWAQRSRVNWLKHGDRIHSFSILVLLIVAEQITSMECLTI